MVVEDASLLRRLATLGIIPEAVVQVEAIAEDGVVSLHVAGMLHNLAQADACRVDVAPL